MYGLSVVNVNALEIRKASLPLRGSRPHLPDFDLGLVRHLLPDRDILLDETGEGLRLTADDLHLLLFQERLGFRVFQRRRRVDEHKRVLQLMAMYFHAHARRSGPSALLAPRRDPAGPPADICRE